MTIYERPTVLLVEDDRTTRDVFDYALRMEGFRVTLASDGLVALQLLEGKPPDVIVVDVDVPTVSGFDVHQEVMAHADTRRIPIIFVASTASKTPTGVFQTLRKPISPDALVAAVREALSNGEPAKDEAD